MSERFTVVKRGYDMSEVDEYIAQLETTIRNYKEKDNAINNALISAQITASNILKEANDNAGVMKAGAIARLDSIIASISVQKQMVKEFQDDYNKLLQKYMREVNETDIRSLYTKVEDLEDYINKLASDCMSTSTSASKSTSKPKVESAPVAEERQSSWL